MSSDPVIANAGVEAQVFADAGRGDLADAPRDRAVRVVEVAEQDRLFGARVGAGRLLAAVDAMHAHRAALDAALAARHVGLLLGERLVHEAARLVRAGYDAVAAADAGVPVDQHDAVGALERRSGGADVDAGRIGAVLAHHRRARRAARIAVPDLDLADPLRVGRQRASRQAVLGVAGLHALVAVRRAARGVDEHAPAHLRRGGLAGRPRALRRGDLDQPDARREQHAGQGGGAAGEQRATRGAGAHGLARLRRRRRPGPVVVAHCGAPPAPAARAPAAPAMNACAEAAAFSPALAPAFAPAGFDWWHSKQSSLTAA